MTFQPGDAVQKIDKIYEKKFLNILLIDNETFNLIKPKYFPQDS